jgi:RHS repeat-associated protein
MTFQYDVIGNMITRDVGSSYSLAYDAENRLTGVTGSTNASFLYDGDGNRVKGIVGSTTTIYIGNYFEWTGSTDFMKKYYYAGSTRVAVRIGTGSGSTGLSLLLGDQIGSTSITTNSSGVRTGELLYKPWGENRYTYGVTPTSLRFTGQREDSYINLYWYGSRWYDDVLGRFIQPDTMIPDPSNPADYDRYSYVRNNPINITDP